MSTYEFARLEAEHYGYMWQDYNDRLQYEEYQKEFMIFWHDDESETEDVEIITADNEEQAYEKAEEMLGTEIPETAVIDKIVA